MWCICTLLILNTGKLHFFGPEFYLYADSIVDTAFLKNEKQLAVNTIAKDISIIKVFMWEAVDLGFTSNMQFRHGKFSCSEEETDQVYLTKSELDQVYKHKFDNAKLEKVKDLFIFGACVGLRFSDFANIRPENIVKLNDMTSIKLITQKTKEEVIIPCHPIVLDIFQKYENNPNKLPHTMSNQKFNLYLKEVCRIAGSPETGRMSSKPELLLFQAVSSHTARRSFATNHYLEGFSTIDLMKITGHKTEKAFMKYIRVSKLDSALRLAAHMDKTLSERMLKIT